MIPVNRRSRFLWVILGAAFLSRILLILLLRTYQLPPDQDHYLFGYEAGRIARSLAEGGGFASPWLLPSGPTALLPPVYPLLLAGIFSVLGIYTTAAAAAALALNAVFAALTCAALYRLGAELLDRDAGLLAAGVFAVYPASLWQSARTIWDTNLFALALVTCVLLTYRAARARSATEWLLAGGAIGATALVNPAGLSFLPAAMVWAWWRNRAPAWRKTMWLAASAAVALLAMTPWLARNYAVLGRPTLRSGFGLELKLGSGGWSWWRDHPSFNRAEFAKYSGGSEMAYMDECFRQAAAFIRADPAEYSRSVAEHVLQFWVGLPAEAGPAETRPAAIWARVALDTAPLPLAVAGLAMALLARRRLGPLVLMLALFPDVYYVTHASERYRLPIEPFLVLLGSFAALWLWRAQKSEREIDARKMAA